MRKFVWVIVYTHKHGVDVSVFKTYKAAIKVAREWAAQSVEDGCWDSEDIAKFKSTKDNTVAVDFFNEVELGWSYGENIEVQESLFGG